MTDYTTAPFLAVCPNYFGKGFTIEEAKTNLKGQGGSLGQYVVYRLPEGTTGGQIDQMGNLRWKWAEGADRSAKAEIVESRGLE